MTHAIPKSLRTYLLTLNILGLSAPEGSAVVDGIEHLVLLG